ncbi:CarD family transcriptional regulator [Desulfovibrio litoralis]|uniref:Transcriptional regulator, CarD family n=1 Tax=Desulfovibrio litoralis DSM 11393 TaxID=1121455 RepID=A0A1M7SCB4_9BACT|nr:CarD family transcriptional regulator [Desulfovibrio litoralis]SHN56094.1 transcriptional regulator, CarD family [Desulfovibrio litoralis DSM 11393]
MFSLNELIVYPAQGVGRISAIENKTIGGSSLDFYIVCILGTKVTLMVPVKNAANIGLRSLCSREEALLILDSLNNDDGFVGYAGQNWNRRQREYSEKLKSGKLPDVCYVLKDISMIAKNKDLSFGERRIFEQAMNLLCSELSSVLDKEFIEIEKQVGGYLSLSVLVNDEIPQTT